jgi:hypothetical protein
MRSHPRPAPLEKQKKSVRRTSLAADDMLLLLAHFFFVSPNPRFAFSSSPVSMSLLCLRCR